MNRVALKCFALLCVAATPLFGQAPPAPAPAAATPAPAAASAPDALKWSADTLDYSAKPGEESVPFAFFVTNVSQTPVLINKLHTSCGCTVAQLPTTPYTLQPGSNVPINVSMDVRGKQGQVAKSVTAETSAGSKSLTVRVNIPAAAPAAAHGTTPTMDNRAKNITTALADRQAVFKGDCVACHVDKGKGKMGQELYAASCGICHDAEHRAAMVPDLKIAKGPRDISFWQKWTMEGKPGTMMPAFAQAHGGPLTQEQIDSLTVYLYQNYPKAPPTTASTPATSVPSTITLPTPAKN